MDTKFFKHSFYTPIRENVGLNVYNSGYQQCQSGHSWGPAVRDYFLIHLVVGGEGCYTIENRTYHVKSGDAFIIPPSTLVSYRADNMQPWEYCWVGFHGADAVRMLSLTPFCGNNRVVNFSDSQQVGRLKQAILAIYQSFGAKPEEESRMLGNLYLFFSILMEKNEKEQLSVSGSQSYIEQAIKFVQYNYSNNIDVLDLASNIGLSRSHLYRIFIKHLGMPPNEYISRFRINQACTLLRSTSLTVGEIANSVGFEDQLYFSRVFKKLKGIPPTKYARLECQTVGSVQLEDAEKQLNAFDE